MIFPHVLIVYSDLLVIFPLSNPPFGGRYWEAIPLSNPPVLYPEVVINTAKVVPKMTSYCMFGP